MNPVAERTVARNDFFDFTRALFDLSKVFGKPEALSDLRVIEFGTLFLGPVTSTILGEFGA